MKLFTCSACGSPVHFDSLSCAGCGHALGFVPERMAMVAVEAGEVTEGEREWRRCAHHEQAPCCNWLVDTQDRSPFCIACRLNRTIPDLSIAEHGTLWRRLEEEKRRLIYSVLRLGLPLVPRAQAADGLAFDFLADPNPSFSDRERVVTGHAEGLITLNIAEADPVARERMRAEMDEPYRTILGHFRHESGHYYWDRLVRDSTWLGPFRELFGDDRNDYAEALGAHYRDGPPADWRDRFISAYATMHPWEDWAESWSHYLHMVDTLETAWTYGLTLEPRHANGAALSAKPRLDPYRAVGFEELISHWMPLTVALNSLNRSMGQEDAYPFALATPVIDKLAFVHRVVREQPPDASPSGVE